MDQVLLQQDKYDLFSKVRKQPLRLGVLLETGSWWFLCGPESTLAQVTLEWYCYQYIPNYFSKGQLSKMFFLFPDPHLKEKNHRRLVISPHQLDEYANTLEVGGIIYTIMDVEELGDWMRSCLGGHPLFEAVVEEDLEKDPVVKLLTSATEEGQKVARTGGQTYRAVYKRIAPQAVEKIAKSN